MVTGSATHESWPLLTSAIRFNFNAQLLLPSFYITFIFPGRLSHSNMVQLRLISDTNIKVSKTAASHTSFSFNSKTNYEKKNRFYTRIITICLNVIAIVACWSPPRKTIPSPKKSKAHQSTFKMSVTFSWNSDLSFLKENNLSYSYSRHTQRIVHFIFSGRFGWFKFHSVHEYFQKNRVWYSFSTRRNCQFR